MTTPPGLPIEGVDDVQSRPLSRGGVRHIVRLPNGRGAIVIHGKDPISSGVVVFPGYFTGDGERGFQPDPEEWNSPNPPKRWYSLNELAAALLRMSRLPAPVEDRTD